MLFINQFYVAVTSGILIRCERFFHSFGILSGFLNACEIILISFGLFRVLMDYSTTLSHLININPHQIFFLLSFSYRLDYSILPVVVFVIASYASKYNLSIAHVFFFKQIIRFQNGYGSIHGVDNHFASGLLNGVCSKRHINNVNHLNCFR